MGAGSGYQAAVLCAAGAAGLRASSCGPSSAPARSSGMETLGYANVEIGVFDGTYGWRERAPFDAILVAAGAPDDSAAARRSAGRRRPAGDSRSGRGREQRLAIVTRRGDELHDRVGDAVLVRRSRGQVRMGRRRSGARMTLRASLVVALAVGGCATVEVEPATSTIRELTVTPSDATAGCAAMLWPVEGTLSSPFGARDGRSPARGHRPRRRRGHAGARRLRRRGRLRRQRAARLRQRRHPAARRRAGDGLRAQPRRSTSSRARWSRAGRSSRAPARPATPPPRTCTSRYESGSIARDPLGYLSRQ